jgi:hypothetical protein
VFWAALFCLHVRCVLVVGSLQQVLLQGRGALQTALAVLAAVVLFAVVCTSTNPLSCAQALLNKLRKQGYDEQSQHTCYHYFANQPCAYVLVHACALFGLQLHVESCTLAFALTAFLLVSVNPC